MASYSYFQNFLERQIYIDLVFAVQTLYREFPMLDRQVIEQIEDRLTSFYENNGNSRIKPRTICAVLVYHYGNKVAITMSQTCKVFDINITWFRKKRKDYLQKLGIDTQNQVLNQFQYSEWRLYTSLRLSEHSLPNSDKKQGNAFQLNKNKGLEK